MLLALPYVMACSDKEEDDQILLNSGGRYFLFDQQTYTGNSEAFSVDFTAQKPFQPQLMQIIHSDGTKEYVRTDTLVYKELTDVRTGKTTHTYRYSFITIEQSDYLHLRVSLSKNEETQQRGCVIWVSEPDSAAHHYHSELLDIYQAAQ